MRSLFVTAVLATVGCSDASKVSNVSSNDSKQINTKTPNGTFTARATTVDPVPQKITKVEGNELKSLQSLASQGPEFVATYLPNTQDPVLKDYDSAFRAWQISDSPKHSNEQVIQILGAYLGNKCVADLDMEWVTITDEYGTDYAVRSKTVEVMAFPFSSVLKRIEKKQYDFMHGVYHAVKQTLASGDHKRREK